MTRRGEVRSRREVEEMHDYFVGLQTDGVGRCGERKRTKARWMREGGMRVLRGPW